MLRMVSSMVQSYPTTHESVFRDQFLAEIDKVVYDID